MFSLNADLVTHVLLEIPCVHVLLPSYTILCDTFIWHSSFYVDDGLTGADTVDEGIELQQQLQELFNRGGFTLRKWNSRNSAALARIPDELKDSHTLLAYLIQLNTPNTWNTVMDHF